MLENNSTNEAKFTKDFTAGVLIANQALVNRVIEIDEEIEVLTREKEGHLTLLADLETIQSKADSNIEAMTLPADSSQKKKVPANVTPKASAEADKLPPAKSAEPPFIPDEKECRKLANRIAKLLEKENRSMRSVEIRTALGLPNDPAFWQPVLAAMLQHPNITSEGEKLQKKYLFKPSAE